jgi:hypothetical protein
MAVRLDVTHPGLPTCRISSFQNKAPAQTSPKISRRQNGAETLATQRVAMNARRAYARLSPPHERSEPGLPGDDASRDAPTRRKIDSTRSKSANPARSSATKGARMPHVTSASLGGSRVRRAVRPSEAGG